MNKYQAQFDRCTGRFPVSNCDKMGMSPVALQGLPDAKLIEVSTMPKGIFPRKRRKVIFPIGPSIAYVPLTMGLYSLIDAQDACRIHSHNWHARLSDGIFYAARTDNDFKKIRLHRVLCAVEEGLLVDHVNGNGLDNRQANLRPATPIQNGQNVRKNTRNSSGYKGVHFKVDKKAWVAQIIANGKHYWLGQFKTPELASHAYEKAAAELHGDFRRSA